MNKFILLAALIAFSINLTGQEQKSLHQETSEHYNSLGISAEEYEKTNVPAQVSVAKHNRNCQLNKIVFGWHPYWMNNLEANYNWDMLSDFSYFSYEVDPNTGDPITTRNWATAQAVTTALSKGVRVNLCVTIFGNTNNTTFLTNATAKQKLINNLISLIQSRGAHGVNIDFEEVPSAQKTNLTNFMVDLSNAMHAQIPGSQVSIALPAVDWGNTFDVAAMSPYVDLFLIMGYDYYWGGSTQAGPTDPLYIFDATVSSQHLTRSVNTYLTKGIPASKLALGLPYYGREYNTTSNTVPSSATSQVASRTYKFVKDNASGNYSNPQLYLKSMTTYHVYNSGNWRQLFINDAFTLGKRYDMVNQRGLAGIGIWSLGGDDGYNDLWNKIEEKFSSCATFACNDTLYDMGGPQGNYYDSEDFTFQIKPTGASQINFNFKSFSLGAGDTLRLYNGASLIPSALIGTYTGTNGPGTFASTVGTVSMRFKANAATVGSGWEATYSCIMDNVPPTTQISTPPAWATQNFTTNFTDADNSGGTGVDKSFYHVSDFNGTEWRANATRGFFNDEFNTAVHADWTSHLGTWGISNGALYQSDATNGNTNIAAPLAQNLSNRYLYHWKGKIEGSGTNRRAGLHYFCDNAALSNRGNSYFVWFRIDDNKVQLYKVANDVFSLVDDVPYTLNAGQVYDYKVAFDRITGKTQVWIDNNLVTTWTDSSPYTNGSHVSFRSGNALYTVDDFRVYRTRNLNLNINVGAASTNDIRFQNPDPSTPSGRIRSVVSDNVGNISSIATVNVNVDWTAPAAILDVNDGTGTDIDSTFVQGELSANWSPTSDPHSGIAKYWYAIGSTAGDSNIVSWTDNLSNLQVTHSGITLIDEQDYYFSVRAENGAGLIANFTTSDGQTYYLSTGFTNTNGLSNRISISPNPATQASSITYSIERAGRVSISIIDLTGKEFIIYNIDQQSAGNHNLQFNPVQFNLASGVYFLKFNTESGMQLYKFAVN
jgi:spore germination protein YaaH